MRLKIFLAGCLLISGCKARKVDTEILKASSTTKMSSTEQAKQSTLDTGTVHKLIITNKQSESNGKTTIYPTQGKPFTFSNGSFVGTADSITETGTFKSNEQNKQDSSARYGITSKTELNKALISQQAKNTEDKSKKTEATPMLSPGLLWVLALVAAGFILWEAWQWLKNKI